MATMKLTVLALLSAFVLLRVRAQGGASCNITKPCSNSDAPCCSEYGFCGTDSFCLGGCDPRSSHSLTSCRPEPICVNSITAFPNNNRIHPNSTTYNGNASAYDWVLDKGNIMNTNASGGELALLLTKSNGGTRISSTHYIHYGKITATLKTGRWAGVVTAFITMSDLRDEIDWEFPGTNITQAQSNFFWQGVIPQQTNGQTHQVSSSTYSNYHDYTINWTPTAITFSIDGQTVRTVSSASAGGHFPTTPSRIQLSLWPAGISGSPPGTVQWAGGMINWGDPDYVAAGHFYALVKSITVQCQDPSTGTGNVTNPTGYVFTNATAVNPSVTFTNHSTLLGAAARQGELAMVRGIWVAVVALMVGMLSAFIP